MPYGSYSPWQEAGAAAERLGSSLNNTTLGLAQLRYQKALRDQQMQMALQQALAQNSLRAAQERHLDVENQRLKAATDIDVEKLSSARSLGGAMRQRLPQPEPGMGPSAEGARRLTLGDIVQHAATSGALAGKGGDFIMPHNVGPNNVAIDSMGNLIGQGPMVLPQNAMYQMPGGQPVMNPGRVSLPAGGMSFSPTGGPTFTNTNPSSAGVRHELTPNEALRARMDPGYEELDPTWRALIDATTNRMGGATGPVPDLVPPSLPGGRVRVISPDGKPGTVSAESLEEALRQGYKRVQ